MTSCMKNIESFIINIRKLYYNLKKQKKRPKKSQKMMLSLTGAK